MAAAEPVTIGTAVVAYVEPHEGRAREFNAWYERDHFYAAAMAGPGMYAGARWVATRDLKARRPGGVLLGDPARGSYLATYWVLPGMQTEWDEWSARTYASMPPERLFAGRDHLHTAVYRFAWDRRAADAPVPATALDHPFAGVAVVASTDGCAVEAWAGSVVGDEVPLVVGLERERVILSTVEPADHSLAIAFCRADASAVALPGDAGFAGAFVRTVPGTDRYTDEL
jgi:hypothetical protein